MRVTSSAECSCSLRCSAGTGYAQSTARRFASVQRSSGAAHAARQRAPARRLLVRLAASLQTQAPAGSVALAEGLAAWLEQRGVPREKSNAVAACGADGALQLVTARPVARCVAAPARLCSLVLMSSLVSLRERPLGRRTPPRVLAPDCAVTWCTRRCGRRCEPAPRAWGRGQPLFSVPAGAWLAADAVARSPLGPLVAGLEPWLQLALFLLAERAAPRSPWRPYLDALPEECGAPLFWSDAELAELEGTQVLTSVRGYRRAPARPERERRAGGHSLCLPAVLHSVLLRCSGVLEVRGETYWFATTPSCVTGRPESSAFRAQLQAGGAHVRPRSGGCSVCQQAASARVTRAVCGRCPPSVSATCRGCQAWAVA